MPFGSHWSGTTSSFLLKPIPLRRWKQVLSGSRDFRMGIFPTPSSKRDAYCVFARSNSDCRSRVLEPRSNERCRSRDENRWKTRTQPSLGEEKASMLAGLAWLPVSSASCEKGFSRLDLVVKGLNPLSTSRELDIEPFVTNICCIKKKSS